jgi:hypothetical protein
MAKSTTTPAHTPAPAIDQKKGVASDAGMSKRSIDMKMFATPDTKKKVMAMDPGQGIAVGQIVGGIVKVTEKQWPQKDGSFQISLSALGDFQATEYTAGEILEGNTANLPKYYLEAVRSMIELTGRPIECALEIWLVATGKNIPIAYEVKNLVRRPADSIVNRLKREMAEAGRLRLPPPPMATALLPGEVREIGGDVGQLIEHQPAATEPEVDENHVPQKEVAASG